MKKSTKIFSVLLILILSLNVTAYAQSSSDKEFDKVQKELQKLETKYDVEFDFDYYKNNIKSDELILEFDSVEKYEEFLKKDKETKSGEMIELEYNVSNDTMSVLSINDTDTISWWAPFVNIGTGVFCWNNVDLEYKYDWKDGNPYFVQIDKVTSYITGVSLSSWTQTSKATNIVDKYHTDDKVEVKVNGTYFIGIAIKGFTIGSTSKDTWECSLTLVTE